MPKTARLIGSAGSGKTTELLGHMESAKAALGGSPFALGFASLTRAARAEAVSRASAAWGVPADVLARDGWFKTAHGVAHKMLGIKKGELIDETKASAMWVAQALKVDVRVILDDDSGYALYAGDKAAAAALNCWEVSRARVEPLRDTISRMARTGQDPPTFAECRQFIKRYEDAKRLEERCDFSDLLARYAGIKFDPDGFFEVEPEGKVPPGVKAWIFDEAQDASALVDRVCKRLAHGPEVQWVYIAGDPFQSVFSFGGSDSRHFMSWPADKERVMKKSWRCPRPVLELGERCLRQMKSGYWDREVEPADHDGEVVRGGFRESIIPKLDPLTPTLIVARCNYTLDDWAADLKRKGTPFARLKSKDNTIALRAANALWSLEHGNPVSGDDLACAIEELPSRGAEGAMLTRGTKTMWNKDETKRRFDLVFPSDLEDAGMTPALQERIMAGRWADLIAGGDKWRRAAVKFGPDLATRPHIRLGTVHSAKGMEADVVVLATDTSRRVHESQTLDPEQHDEERRIEYVGVTRAKRKLIIAATTADYRMNLKL